jgi:CubicO group peptidase (beta-lactamase class C family)
MNKSKLTPLLLLFVLLSQISLAQMSKFWADTLDQLLMKSATNESMNGIAGSVVFSDGSVWSSAEGFHGNEALSTDFLFDIGSNTKSMVATIILLLEEEGKLSLKDTLYSYLPPIKNVGYGITIEHLLKHRSGVFSYTEHKDFYDEIEADDYKFWHPDTLLSRFLNPPHFKPGAKFRYSNTGYILLGKVIEAIENKPLNEVLKERLFEPYGLENMFLAQYDEYTSTKTGAWLSPSYYYPSIESFLSAAWAAGGVVSRPEDFAQYAHKLLRGDILNETSMQKMSKGTKLNGGSIYGLGIMKTNYKGHEYLGHGGTTLQNSEMMYSVESDFSLVLINIDNNYYDEVNRVKNDFLELLEYIEENHESLSTEHHQKESNTISAYPNPSLNRMTINIAETNTACQKRIEIRDITGKLVFSNTLVGNQIEVDKQQVGSGLFLLSIIEEGTIVESKRISFK